ncbi:MAG TPA: FYDLN acid domain-containing protein, partial [Myxococcota bacterium]|nr:FYDLN acid domain-containing protein [Myxococcota bacterium]
MDAARKTKLGQKWTCYSCQAKFYDLQKPDPKCPKCGADQRQSPAFEKPKR